MKEILLLLLGALGAIIAIFMKEAVQHALQRRVIAWQLFGYLMAWKSNIIKSAPLAALYLKVEERDKQLVESFSQGTAAFRVRWEQQYKQRDEIRKDIREAIEKALVEKGDIKIEQSSLNVIALAATEMSHSRTLLADSKSFISDKDAAMLGRQIAVHAIQFRTALLAVLAAIESGMRIAELQGEQRASMSAHLIDQVVIQGEMAMVAFIRLEQHVDRLTQQTVPKMTWNVLRGR